MIMRNRIRTKVSIIGLVCLCLLSCKSPTEPSYPVIDIPVLLSPQDGAVLDNGRRDGKDYFIWDFDWTDVSGATKFNLYVKHSGSKYPVIDEEIYSSSHQKKGYGGFVANHNRFDWKWKVRAYVGSRWRDWSEERSFDVEPEDTDPPMDE